MLTVLIRIFWLFVGHAVCDFGLQSGYMAEGKDPFKPDHWDNPWFWCMFPHCLLHAGAVYLITQNFYLALAELVVHFLADVVKCKGITTFSQDQMCHYACKIVWGILA